MSKLLVETGKVGKRGVITLPASQRKRFGLEDGSLFISEEREDGILLRPALAFPEVDLDQVVGCLRSKRKSKTLAQMNSAIRREVMRRHDRGRY